jgi:8-oxo-dGTP pyrophosphatase MutT (NUDIX family)
MSEKPPYDLKSRNLACENSQFEVFYDHIESENGFVVEDYITIIPKRRLLNDITGVAILPIVNNKIALLKVYRHIIEDWSWEIPRGFIELGENKKQSAIRELEEETSLLCESDAIHSLGYLSPDAGILKARVHIFSAEECYFKKPFTPNEIGHSELRMFSFSEALSMADTSKIQDPYTLTGIYRYLRKKNARKTDAL